MKRKCRLFLFFAFALVVFAVVTQTDTSTPAEKTVTATTATATTPASTGESATPAASTTATATPAVSTATTAKPALSITHDANKRAVNLGFEAKQTDQYYLLEGRSELDKGDWSLSYGIKGDGQAKTTPMPAHKRMGFFRLTQVEAGHALLKIDHDEDLLPTGFEINSGLNPASRSGKDTFLDPEQDGSNNLLEYRKGTNPQKKDTDGDGLNDAEDAVGYDPAFSFKAAPETVYRVIDLGEYPKNSYIQAVNNRGTVILKKSYSQFTLRQLGKTARDYDGQFVDLNNKDDYIHTYGLKHYLNGGLWFEETRERKWVDGTKKNLDIRRDLLGIEDSGRIWYRQINEFSRDIKKDKNYQVLRGYSAGTFYGGATLAGSTHTYTWHKSTTINEEGEKVVDFDKESTRSVYQAHLNEGAITATAGGGGSMIGSTTHRFGSLRHNGDYFSTYFTVTSDEFDLRGNAPGHTFSDGYSLAGHGVYTIGRLPGQSGLWKSWKDKDNPRLSLGAPQSGQAIRNGPGGDALHVLSIADNGLLLTREESTHTQPAKLWRNGRLLTDAEILGADSAWSQLNIRHLSDNGNCIAAYAKNADQKWHNLLLLKVDIVDKDKNSVSELKIGKMEGALSSTGVLDIDQDEDRFFVRISGAAALKNVSVKLSTVDNPDSSYDDDETEIELEVDGNDLITKSLLLVSDDIDDDYAGNGVGADDAKNDRTHKVQLGGKVQVKSITIDGTEYPINMKTDVPPKKKVNVSVIIVRETAGGAQSASNQAVEAEMKRAQERYAQIAVDLNWSIKVMDPPSGVNLSDGLTANPLVNPEMSSLFSAATVATNDLEIFFVNDLIYSSGATLYGIGYAKFAATSQGYSGVDGYENTAIINWDASSPLPGRQVIAHEIGHILTNSGHSGGPLNLMESGSVRNTVNNIKGGRRLVSSQQNAVYNNALSSNP